MKIKHALVGLAFVSLFTNALADNAASIPFLGYLTGSNYEAMGRLPRMTYLEGTVDGMIVGADASGDGHRATQFSRCIVNMHGNQLLAIVDKYMTDNPTRWDTLMSTLTYNAMNDACAARGFPLPH
jgi:hypothetical protein